MSVENSCHSLQTLVEAFRFIGYQSFMLVAGVDGCRAGWVAFNVEVHSITTSVEVADLPAWLRGAKSLEPR